MLTLTPPRPNLWYYRDDCLKMALEPGEAEISPMGTTRSSSKKSAVSALTRSTCPPATRAALLG